MIPKLAAIASHAFMWGLMHGLLFGAVLLLLMFLFDKVRDRYEG